MSRCDNKTRAPVMTKRIAKPVRHGSHLKSSLVWLRLARDGGSTQGAVRGDQADSVLIQLQFNPFLQSPQRLPRPKEGP